MANDYKRGIRVYLETSDYGKGIEAMVAATGKYEDKLAELRKEAEKMTASGQNSGKAWDDLQTKIKQNESQLKKSQTAEVQYREKLEQTKKVLNNLSGVSYNELVTVQKQLQKELKDTTRGTEEHKTKLAQLERVNKEVSKSQAELNSNLGKNNSLFGRLTDVANKYFNIAIAGVAAITGISLTFRRLAEDVAKMDDVYSDVMKTTGLTKEEVIALNEQLKKLDTRTGREQLNQLASDAGKLGIEGSKNIMDFVDAGNQINVALGEDLGEDAIKNIGKLTQTFAKSTKELEEKDLKGKMLAIGSAVNSIGQSSTAQESYLVEFAQRVSGAFSQAGISLQNTLGYASALDQAGQGLEMSATAMQQFVMKVFEDPAKFAKLAGVEVNKFRKLLGEDTNQAIITVLTSLSKKGGFAQLVPIFNQMGLDGARAVGVLSSLASNIELVNEAQEQANTSFKEGTSITNEYDVKNNNLAAKLDKAKKAFTETALELGEKLNPILLKSVNGTTYLIKALVELPKWLKENKGLLITLGLVTLAYVIALEKARIASALWYAGEKIKIFWTKASTAATFLHVAATGYLTGATRAANLAMKQFFITIGLNPITALVAVLALATIGFYKLVTSQTAAEKAYKEYNKQVGIELTKSDQLFNALKKTNEGSSERKSLIAKINSLYGDYLGYQLNEKMSLIEINKAQLKVNDAIREKIALQIKDSSKADILNESIPEQTDIADKFIKSIAATEGDEVAEIIYNRIKSVLEKNNFSDASVKWTQGYLKRMLGDNFTAGMDFYPSMLAKSIKKMNSDLADVDKKFERIIGKSKQSLSGDSIDSGNETSNTVGGGNGIDEKDQEERYNKEFKAALDAKERDYKESQLELVELRRKGELTERTYNEINLRNQLAFLYDKKKIQKQYGKETIDTEIEIENQRLKINETADNAILKTIQDFQDSGIAAIESGNQTKQDMLQHSLNRQLITEKEYNREIKKLAVEMLATKIALAEASVKAIETANFADKAVKDAAFKKANDDLLKLKGDLVKAQGDLAKDTAKEVEDNTKTVAERMESIFGSSFSNISKLFASFTENLNKLKNSDLSSWEDWGSAIGSIVQSSLEVAQQINEQYYEYKAAGLEADKQRELTNAGDNAEAREAINNKYAQKELDLKKKQSSADTVLKVAQAVAAGGLAIVQAFAQLGPVGGAIAAVLVGGITALQVGTIVKQNAAIQNTTLDSSVSSDSSSASSGTRVAQAASGRWDVIGEEDGKVYRNVPYRGVARTGIITAPTLVAEQGDEAIIDNPTLRNIRMNAPWILSVINKMRVPQRASGSYPETVSQSSSGSFSQTTNDTLLTANMEVLKRLVVLLTFLIDNGIDANVYLDKLEKKIALKNKSLKKGSS